MSERFYSIDPTNLKHIELLDDYNKENGVFTPIGQINKEKIQEDNEFSMELVLPIDFAVTTEYSNDTETTTKAIYELGKEDMGLDIGEKSIQLFEDNLKDAKIVVWNGPLGVYEFEKYKLGTDTLLKYLVDNNIKTILGGGDIVAAASNAGYKDKVYHASTGGGATLEYLEGKELPGLAVIK